MGKFQLIKKQPITDINGHLQPNEMFYKYSYMNNFVWFTQHADSGNIYSITVQLDPELAKYFNCWTNTSEPDYYPTEDSIKMEIKQNDLLTSHSFEELVTYVECAKELRAAIIAIFNFPEHKLLWRYYHEQSKTSNDD